MRPDPRAGRRQRSGGPSCTPGQGDWRESSKVRPGKTCETKCLCLSRRRLERLVFQDKSGSETRRSGVQESLRTLRVDRGPGGHSQRTGSP